MFSFIIGLSLLFALILLSPSDHSITIFELFVLPEFRPDCLFYRRYGSVTIRKIEGYMILLARLFMSFYVGCIVLMNWFLNVRQNSIF